MPSSDKKKDPGHHVAQILLFSSDQRDAMTACRTAGTISFAIRP